jgi:hypothetical protein
VDISTHKTASTQEASLAAADEQDLFAAGCAILIVFCERDLAAAAAEKRLRGMLVKTASVI